MVNSVHVAYFALTVENLITTLTSNPPDPKWLQVTLIHTQLQTSLMLHHDISAISHALCLGVPFNTCIHAYIPVSMVWRHLHVFQSYTRISLLPFGLNSEPGCITTASTVESGTEHTTILNERD